MGKSNATVYVETDTKVTFADVAGIDETSPEARRRTERIYSPFG